MEEEMQDLSHLSALETRLSHEREYLRAAQATNDSKAIAIREVWIAQIEKEIAAEYKFLGIAPPTASEMAMSDDELLAALNN